MTAQQSGREQRENQFRPMSLFQSGPPPSVQFMQELTRRLKCSEGSLRGG